MSAVADFVPLAIAVLTISDTRTTGSDTSGQALVTMLKSAGHTLHEQVIVRDDVHAIRHKLTGWIADGAVNAVITTGGTGFSGRDSTPEAVQPLLEKSIEGFGELFRHLSYAEIGTSTIQSRALAGLSNYTVIFCLPGSTGACRTGWEKIICEQLDARHQPCNFIGHLLQKPGCQTRSPASSSAVSGPGARRA